MKDDEIEEMTGITVNEFRFVRALYYKMVGIPAAPMDEDEETALMRKIGIAASAARKKSAAAKVRFEVHFEAKQT